MLSGKHIYVIVLFCIHCDLWLIFSLIKCEHCQKTFTSIFTARQHESVHTGEVLKCAQCDKTYSNKANLDRHAKNAHPKTQHKTTQTFITYTGASLKCRYCGEMLAALKPFAAYEHGSNCAKCWESNKNKK